MKTRNELPQSAFTCNGVWFEDIIPGYHTLNTYSRNLLEKELTLREASTADGAVLTSSRYPVREIEVEYLIEAGGVWEEFQTSYQLLMEQLDKENAVIIFNGEPDKYIVGTFVAPAQVDEEQHTRTGKYKIVCADPFKYSVNEYVVAASSDEWDITYDGTYRSHPTFVFDFPKTLDANGDNTATSECGYVGLANQSGAVLQFGDPEEKNWGTVVEPMIKPIDKTFQSINGWTVNGSATLGANYVQTGTVAVNSTDKYVYADDYDTGSNYHGPSISKAFTNASYKNWKFSFKQVFEADKSHFGCFLALVYNNNSGTRTLLGGLELRKTDKNAKTKVFYYAGSTTAKNAKKAVSIACNKIKTCAITKQDQTVTFNFGNKSATAQLDTTKADMLANEVVFYFGKNKSQAAMNKNYLNSARMELFSYSYYGNIENVFMPGDVLTVDTQNAEIYLDGGDSTTPANNIGALGNDWEDFVLVPGANLIKADYSDFTTVKPTAVMKYRKVYL